KPVEQAKIDILERLESLPDKELMLGALAEVVNDFLFKYKQKDVKDNSHQENQASRLLKGSKA
nr:hypothetical protein [Candidatus Brocadiales bacterium]